MKDLIIGILLVPFMLGLFVGGFVVADAVSWHAGYAIGFSEAEYTMSENERNKWYEAGKRMGYLEGVYDTQEGLYGAAQD